MGILGAQAAVHAGIHRMEEMVRPTPEDWPWFARYYLREARIANSWNPYGEAKGAEARKEALDKVLRELKGRGVGFGVKSGRWGEEEAALRKERGAWFEEEKKWKEAVAEYEAALEVGGSGVGIPQKVAAAGRLASVFRFLGKEEEAMQALERGVREAEVGGVSNALMNAKMEFAVGLARKGELVRAAEVAAGVLEERMRARPGCVDPKRFGFDVGDPCRVAGAMAVVGELVFALGRKEEGVVWSERAFETAWEFVEYRLACKECAGVAARNLVQMGKILEDGGGDREEGWFTRGVRKENERRRREGERVRTEYGFRAMEVEAVRAVKDSRVAKALGG